MRIARIEIHGFKSFSDRTVFQFGAGISCVVGPNGCGKSNVIDAIKWGLGEQNARNLRGRGMEDVIFGGSESRPPTGLAEVSLLFDNSAGALGGEYARAPHVEVRRRLFRSGESEYLLNGEQVRLRDVTSLFLDTGVGSRGYSIIEQGRVGLIVNARPEERRFLVEDAAGISRYKSHRADAERRLEQTQQNLARIRDVADELRKRVASLKRAAARATRYRALRSRVRLVDLFLALSRTRELVEEYRARADEVAALDGRIEDLATRLARGESEATRLLEARSRASADADRVKERRSQAQSAREIRIRDREYRVREAEGLARRGDALEAEVARAESRIGEVRAEAESLAAEVARLEAESEGAARRLAAEATSGEALRKEAEATARAIDQLKRQAVEALTEVTRTRAQIAGIERREEDMRARRERAEHERGSVEERVKLLEADRARLGAEVEAAGVRTAAARDRLAEGERDVGTAREAARQAEGVLRATLDRLSARRARLRSLREIQQRFEGFQRGARDVMSRGTADPASGIVGTVADLIDVPAEWERAIEAVLGDRLQAVVVKEPAHALEAVADLRARGAGRAHFVPLAGTSARVAVASPGERALTESVRPVADEFGPALDRLLRGTSWVDSLEDALRSRAQDPGDPRTFVTRDGDVLAPDGVVAGGAFDRGGAGLLQQRREMRALQDEVREIEAQEAGGRREAEAGAARLAASQRNVDEARTELHASDVERVARERDLNALERELEGRRHLARTLGGEARDLEAGRADLAREGELLRTKLREVEAVRLSREDQLAAAEGQAEGAAARIDRHREALTDLRMEAAAERQRLDHARRDLERARGEAAAIEARLARDRADLQTSRERSGRLAVEATGLIAEIDALAAAIAEATGEIERALERHRALTERHQAADQGLQGLRRERDDAREASQRGSVRVAELRVELGHVRDAVQERFDVELQPLFRRLDEEGRVDLSPAAPLRPTPELDDGDDGGEPVDPLPPTLAVVTWEDLVDPRKLAAARDEQSALKTRLERLGEVNLTAPEEFHEAAERFEFVSAQQRDIESSLDQIRKAIARIDRTTRERFRETYEAINARFEALYPRLLGGGRGFLRLTDEADLLDTGIDLIVQPPGKKLQNMSLLSGGEKAMAAIALIFAIFQVKPSPFCLLDEVDAPLDEANAGRFNEMVRSMCAQTQFVVITHNKATMEVADTLYGVTMEEPGVSKLVSVRLDAPPGGAGAEFPPLDALPAPS